MWKRITYLFFIDIAIYYHVLMPLKLSRPYIFYNFFSICNEINSEILEIISSIFKDFRLSKSSENITS